MRQFITIIQIHEFFHSYSSFTSRRLLWMTRIVTRRLAIEWHSLKSYWLVSLWTERAEVNRACPRSRWESRERVVAPKALLVSFMARRRVLVCASATVWEFNCLFLLNWGKNIVNNLHLDWFGGRSVLFRDNGFWSDYLNWLVCGAQWLYWLRMEENYHCRAHSGWERRRINK